jgi:hypothetical protein
MHPGPPTRNHCTAQRPRSLVVSIPRSAALPRRIAQGVFFVNPDGGHGNVKPSENEKEHADGDGDRDDGLLLSSATLVNLEITHAVVTRGSDPRLSCQWGMKSLFVGPQDPLSKVVAWMRAVRRLGANIIVGDFAAAAGYLVVELGLTPRTAWLRIARGVPPVGDLVLARLCVLTLVHKEKEKEKENRNWSGSGSGNEAALGSSERESGRTTSASGNGDVGGGGTWCHGGGYQGLGISPRSCRRQRFRTRAGSGLKHVVAN